MVLDLFLLITLIIVLGIGYNIAYTKYKDREWRKNNPDEYKFTETINQEPSCSDSQAYNVYNNENANDSSFCSLENDNFEDL